MVDAPSPSRRSQALRRWLPWLARLLVCALLVGWFVFFVDHRSFARAFASIPLKAFVPAVLLGGAVLTLASVRWLVLMRAFGADDLPSLLRLGRLFLIGLFYNTFVPGAVGGDLLRGVVTRRFFDRPAVSYVVVFLERLIGLTAMGIIFLAGLLLVPEVIDLRENAPWVGAFVALALVAVAIAAAGGRLERLRRQIPPVRPLGLVWVFLISLIAHMTAITAMFLLANGMELPLSYAELVLVMPLAFTATALPINLLGIGGRELTLVTLLGMLDVAAEQALALSLGYGLVHNLWALLGGLLHLIQGRVSPVARTE